MTEAPTAQKIPGSDPSAAGGSQRRWSAQIAAGALFVQALVYAAVVALRLLGVNWDLTLDIFSLPEAAYLAAITALILAPVIVALLIAALLILVRPPLGWTVAQFIQTVLLLIGVQLYFTSGDPAMLLPVMWRDFLMLGSILVVIYLNSPEGRLLLARRSPHAPPHEVAPPPYTAHG